MNNRGLSPVIGIIFVIGFVVIVGMGLFIFGQGLITGDEDPNVDSSFSLEFEDTDRISVIYDTGNEFNSQNTDRLFVIGQNSSGEDIDFDIYDGSSLVEDTEEPELTAGMVAVSADRAQEENVDPGSALQFVWEPSAEDDVQIIVDEIAVPDEATIINQEIDETGEFFDEGSIEVGGCHPAENHC